MKLWLYADGRRVWIQNAGYLEQRLTPEGVELLRSEALSTGHRTDEPPPPMVHNCGPGVPVGTDGCVPPMPPPAPDEPYTLPWWLNVVSPEAGRLTRVDRARDLDRLVKRLSDPGSWLPASAWASPPAAGLRAGAVLGVLRDVDGRRPIDPGRDPVTAPDDGRRHSPRPAYDEERDALRRAARLPDGVRHVFRSRDRGRSAAGRGARCRGAGSRSRAGGRSAITRTLDPGSADGPRVLRALHAARRDRMPGVLVTAEQERSMNARLAVLVSLVMAVTH